MRLRCGLTSFLRCCDFIGVGVLEFFVGAFEIVYFAVFEMPDACGHFVQNVFIVGHEQERAVIFLQAQCSAR